ncbi:hypothetical protein FACS1894110_06470 [Spirochaetia bacterium]|nr:hypothetical protein FACS1894110_06470 [Spirochaetia bacterium]
MKTTKKWSKMLRIGMFGMALTFGLILSGCVTALPFQANQTPVSRDQLVSATKSFKSSKWLGAEALVQRMQAEGMTEILFIEVEMAFGTYPTGKIVYTGR